MFIKNLDKITNKRPIENLNISVDDRTEQRKENSRDRLERWRKEESQKMVLK